MQEVQDFPVGKIIKRLEILKIYVVLEDEEDLTFIFYCKKWSGKRGSNSRPRPWQGRALPTELFPHLSCFKMVPEARLELARPERRGILNPLRLPIPPLGQLLNYQRC